jgi:Protein kinase domain
MGTGGIIVMKHKGLLFHFWRYYDACYLGIGTWLVSDIQRSPQNLNIWRGCLDLVRPFLNNDPHKRLPFPEPKKQELKELLAQIGNGEIKECFENFCEDEERNPTWITREYDYQNPWVGGMVFSSFVICLDEEVFHAAKWGKGWITRWSFNEIPDDWVTIAEEKSGKVSSIFVFESFYTDRKADLASAGYDSAECLEHSSISSVWRVVERSTGTCRVIKINECSNHRREIIVASRILKRKPPHLVGIVNFTELEVQQDTGRTDPKEAIVMECYDGDFADFCKTTMMPLLPDKKDEFVLHQLAFLKDVALGIRELHELGYVHYDVKPKNVLYKKDEVGLYRFVLCDFEGACRPLKDQKNDDGNVLRGSKRWEYGWDKCKYTRAYQTGRQDSCPPFHVDFETLAAVFRHEFQDNMTLITPLLAVFEDDSKDDEAKIQDMSQLVDSITASLKPSTTRKRQLPLAHGTAHDGDQDAI